MRLKRLKEPRGYLDVQYKKKSKMREQFPQNFEGKNNEIFIYCEVRIFYRESSIENVMIIDGCTLGQTGKCDLMSES